MISYKELKMIVDACENQVNQYMQDGHKHKYAQDVYTLINFIKLFNNSSYYFIKLNYVGSLQNKSVKISKGSVNNVSKELCEQILEHWTINSNTLKILSPGEYPDIGEESLRSIYSIPSDYDIPIIDLLNDNVIVNALRKAESFYIDGSTLNHLLNERSVSIINMQAYSKPNGYDMAFVDYYQYELY